MSQPPSKRSSLPLDNLSQAQREAVEKHLNDLYDNYLEEVSNLIIEAKTMVPNATYDEGLPLDNARGELERYARQANLIAQDYYRNVRAAWAEASQVELPTYEDAMVSSDRAAWQVFHGYSDSDFAGLKFTDVINHRAKSGMTMDDLWAKKTAGYGDADWSKLAKDVINSTTRLTQQLTAEKDPSEPRYARVPSGPTCEFCIMLASRGFVYWTAESAGRNNLYHNDDNCQIVSSWGKMRVNGYDPDGMKKRWQSCAASVKGWATRDRYDAYRADTAEKLTRDEYEKYLASTGDAKPLSYDGWKEKNTLKFDEWKTRQTLAEMRWRDPRWLYDGTEPPITFPDAKQKAETEQARPQEIRTAERLRKHGVRPAFQIDHKYVRNEETGIEERIGLSDFAGGIEIKTPDKARKFRSVDDYMGSAGKKADCIRLIIDNTENPNMSDAQLIEHIKASNRFKGGKVYILTKDEKLRRIK